MGEALPRSNARRASRRRSGSARGRHPSTLVRPSGRGYYFSIVHDLVLIVEDDRDMRELLAEILVEEGYGVGVAEDGVMAMHYLRTHDAPRMILLDWRMPKSDGFEFRRIQRAEADLSQIPVVLMTGDLRARSGPDEFGAAELLIKPIEVDRLIEVVSRYAGPPPS